MDFLECKVCSIQYDEEKHKPRNATCGHELCSKCIKALIKNKLFECPKCRQITKVNRLEDLPVNYGLIDVVRAFKSQNNTIPNQAESKSAGASNADVCKAHSKIIKNRCLKCDRWICEECLNSHTELTGCSIIESHIAIKNLKVEHNKSMDMLISQFDDHTNILWDKILKHDEKTKEINDKKKEIMEKAEKQIKELSKQAEEQAKEIKKIHSEMQEGETQKKNAVQSKMHLNDANSPYTLMDKIEVLEEMKQALSSWCIRNREKHFPDANKHQTTKVDQLEEEKQRIIRKEKNAHLYMDVQVVLEDAFEGHQGTDLYDLDKVNYRSFRVKKAATLHEFLEQVADTLKYSIEQIRLWPILLRTNQTRRPTLLDLETELHKPLIEISDNSNPWNVFIETVYRDSGLRALPAFDNDSAALLFFKYYDPRHKHLHYSGHLCIDISIDVQEMVSLLNLRAGLPQRTELALFEEIAPNIVERLTDLDRPLEKVLEELMDGDFIVFQRADLLDDPTLELPSCRDYFRDLFHRMQGKQNMNPKAGTGHMNAASGDIGSNNGSIATLQKTAQESDHRQNRNRDSQFRFNAGYDDYLAYLRWEHENPSITSFGNTAYDDGFAQERQQQPYVPDSQQIFIGNIPHTITKEEIKREFSRFGQIVNIRIHTAKGMKKQGQSRPNFGFISFRDEKSVNSVLLNRPIFLDGNKRINVEKKKTRHVPY